MAFNLTELDERTRQLMGEEVAHDITGHNLYEGKHLNAQGKMAWQDLLIEAVADHDEVWLADRVNSGGYLMDTYPRRKPSGGYSQVRVPSDAAKKLAEGEFNRFYMRGICRKADENGEDMVEAYRAKQSSNPRPESEALIGTHFNAAGLLVDLRANHEDYVVFGLPPGPNSGLSLKRVHQ